MHDLQLLAKHYSIFPLNEATMVIVDPLLLRQRLVPGTHLLLRGNSLEGSVIILVLVAPELTDETSVLSIFSLAFPA